LKAVSSQNRFPNGVFQQSVGKSGVLQIAIAGVSAEVKSNPWLGMTFAEVALNKCPSQNRALRTGWANIVNAVEFGTTENIESFTQELHLRAPSFPVGLSPP